MVTPSLDCFVAKAAAGPGSNFSFLSLSSARATDILATRPVTRTRRTRERLRPVFIFALYRILLVLAAPLIVAWGLYRCLKDRRYFSSIGDRLGFVFHCGMPT